MSVIRLAAGIAAAAWLAGCVLRPPFDFAQGDKALDDTQPRGGVTEVAATPRTTIVHGPQPRGWLSAAAKSGQPLIYVADGNEVLIYAENGAGAGPIGLITDGVSSAYGLYVDRKRNLYVANWRENTVEKYEPGSLHPSITYSSGLKGPFYEVVDHEGDLFVANSGNGTVTEYLRGSTSASRIAATEGDQADGIDLDREGDVYVAWRVGSNSAGIDEFTPNLIRRQDLGIALVQPQGLLVTHSGAIVVVETNYASAIEEFSPGKTIAKVVLTPPYVLTELALDSRGGTLFASSLVDAVYTTAYPLHAGDSFQRRISLPYTYTYSGSGYGNVQGMALSNGQTF